MTTAFSVGRGRRGLAKEAPLSLNARDRRALSRIADELAKTAPALVSFVRLFNRLTSGEEMPPRRPLRKRLSTTALTWLFITVWSFVTAGLLTIALIMTHTGQASVAGPAASCTASTLLLPCSQREAP